MEMDFSETHCLMTHYCGQPLKIDEIDIFILINVPNGFAHKTKLLLQWSMLKLSRSYLQVNNAYTNPSRLTVIIKIIRRAHFWYELSCRLLPVESNCLRQTGNLDSRSFKLWELYYFYAKSSCKTFLFANKIHIYFIVKVV